MYQKLGRALGGTVERPAQAELWDAIAPAAVEPVDPASALLARLRGLGLRDVARCMLTANRSTVASYRGGTLRLQHVFVEAPLAVQRAVVDFVQGRGAKRHVARRTLLAYAVPLLPAGAARPRRRERAHPDDASAVDRLRAAHGRLNGERFAGALRVVDVRVSRRMRARLGHYAPGGEGMPPEIAIARRHLRRDGWASVLDTLVHEMVHQWQHESGLPVAHDRAFRRKAREVGITPRARRIPAR